MSEQSDLRGLANVSYYADSDRWSDARDWYSDVIGFEPYFNRVGYCEWRIGADRDELGLIDNRFRPQGTTAGPGGTIVFWHVDDVHKMYDRLLALGATPHEPPQERGEGFVTACVLDPFGNLFGVMYNPNFVEAQAR